MTESHPSDARSDRPITLNARAPRQRSATELWWLRPHRLLLCVVLPIYLSFLVHDFQNVARNVYIPGGDYYFGILILLTLATAAALGAGGAPVDPREGLDRRIVLPMGLSAFLLASTLAAYVIWFGPVLADPQMVIDILTGERMNIRDDVETIPGVTSMVQFGMAFVIAHAVRRHYTPEDLRWWEKLGLPLLFVCVLLRSVIWSERLALIEMVLAFVFSRLVFVQFRSRSSWIVANLLPIAAPVALYLLFTGAEYFRSWEYYKNFYSSLWAFTFDRLVNYYATSSNNGIGMLVESTDWPQFTGGSVASWLYHMPGIGPKLLELTGAELPPFDEFLDRHLDAEFNNPSGLFPAIFDVGYLGSIIYFSIIGLMLGSGWRSYVRRHPAGMALFSSCTLFVLEFMRFDYFSITRFTPAFASLMLIVLLSRTVLNQRRVVRAVAPSKAAAVAG